MHRQRQQIFRTKGIKNQRHPLLQWRLGLEQWFNMALLQKVYNIATVLIGAVCRMCLPPLEALFFFYLI